MKAALVSTTEEEEAVDSACDRVLEAVIDRRENGGTPENIRAATMHLIRKLCDQSFRGRDRLETDEL